MQKFYSSIRGKNFERALMMALKNNKKNIETNAYGICINPQHILSSF